VIAPFGDALEIAELSFPGSLPGFQMRFPDEAVRAAYLETARWRDGFVCPPCETAAERSVPKTAVKKQTTGLT
jgi:hypothetical protein